MGDLTFNLLNYDRHEANMIDADDYKGGNKTEAAAAQKKYTDALEVFYTKLPRGDGQEYFRVIKAKALALHQAWGAYIKAGGEKMEYMDAYSFNEYYAEQYKKAHPPKKENKTENKTNGTKNESKEEELYVSLDAKPTAWAELETL